MVASLIMRRPIEVLSLLLIAVALSLWLLGAQCFATKRDVLALLLSAFGFVALVGASKLRVGRPGGGP